MDENSIEKAKLGFKERNPSVSKTDLMIFEMGYRQCLLDQVKQGLNKIKESTGQS